MEKIKPLFTTYQWIAIIGGLLTTLLAWTAFAFTTFVQKSDLHEDMADIRSQLREIREAVK